MVEAVPVPRIDSSMSRARFVQGKVNFAQITYKTRGETAVEGEIAGT
jgi:hypothetical protein